MRGQRGASGAHPCEQVVAAHGNFDSARCIRCGRQHSVAHVRRAVFAGDGNPCLCQVRGGTGALDRMGAGAYPMEAWARGGMGGQMLASGRAANAAQRSVPPSRPALVVWAGGWCWLGGRPLPPLHPRSPPPKPAPAGSFARYPRCAALRCAAPCRSQACGTGFVKPDIVFFGEALPRRFFERAQEDFPRADLLIVMGTSLVVQPFASLIGAAGRGGWGAASLAAFRHQTSIAMRQLCGASQIPGSACGHRSTESMHI